MERNARVYVAGADTMIGAAVITTLRRDGYDVIDGAGDVVLEQSATVRSFFDGHRPPYVIVAGTDGRFTLDLPPGRYRLTAISEPAGPVSVDAVSTDGASTAPDLVLDESQWIATQHKNKFGQDYPAAAYKK